MANDCWDDGTDVAKRKRPNVSINGRGVRFNFGGGGKLMLVSDEYGDDFNAKKCTRLAVMHRRVGIFDG